MAMNFELDDVEQLLEREAQTFFNREWSLDDVRSLEENNEGYSQVHWRRLCDLGWLTWLRLNSDATGGITALVVIAKEMGYGLFPSPLIDLAATVHILKDHSELCDRFLIGEATASLAWLESKNRQDPSQLGSHHSEGSGTPVLSGTRCLVRDADTADWILWPVPSGGETHVLLIDGENAHLQRTLASRILGDRYFDVTAERLTQDSVQSFCIDPRVVEEARGLAGVVTCGLMAGASRRVLEMTASYAKERHQFGRPIGAFQGVQWLCVDIATRVHRLELLTWKAASAMDGGKPFATDTAVCIAFGARTIHEVMRYAHEIFAGLGYMTAHDLHLFSRRAKGWAASLGGLRRWHDLLAVRHEPI